MQFHGTLVTFGDHESQRIEVAFGSFALFAGKIAAPRLKVGLIERIGFGTYLEEDGIDAIRMQFVEFLDEAGLHLRYAHLFVFALTNRLDPRSAKLMFGILSSRVRNLNRTVHCAATSQEKHGCTYNSYLRSHSIIVFRLRR